MKLSLNEYKQLLANQKKITAESWGTESYYSNETLLWKLKEIVKDLQEEQEIIMLLLGVK